MALSHAHGTPPHARVRTGTHAQVPVALLEGKIATALGENLEAIREFVTAEPGAWTAE